MEGVARFTKKLASNLYALGVQPRVIQSVLRHSSMSTMVDFYVQQDKRSRPRGSQNAGRFVILGYRIVSAFR